MIKNPFALNGTLSVILQGTQSASGEPYALEISLIKLSRYLVRLSLFVFICLLGSLLFFRELEINRKLQDEVLSLKTEQGLYKTYPLPDRTPAHAAAAATAAPIGATDDSQARVNELRTDCVGETCKVRIGMVTHQTGLASGQILVVLEAEVPRIGGADPTAPVRKRFFLYPSNTTQDELDPNTLVSLPHKAFHFSHALQTTAVFNTGKLLRPLAVNVYIFDMQKNLLQHERKVIDSEVSP